MTHSNDKFFASGSLQVAFSGIKFFYPRTCRFVESANLVHPSTGRRVCFAAGTLRSVDLLSRA